MIIDDGWEGYPPRHLINDRPREFISLGLSTYSEMNTEEFSRYIDECYRLEHGETQGLGPEYLGVTIDDPKYYQTFEVTINFPKKEMSLLQHIECYRAIWQSLCDYYRPRHQTYFIEYCKSGEAHLHGYIEIGYLPQLVIVEDEHLLKEFARRIFNLLPKKYWKQFPKMEYHQYFRRLKCPAVCLNLKNYLSVEWAQYIEKNAH